MGKLKCMYTSPRCYALHLRSLHLLNTTSIEDAEIVGDLGDYHDDSPWAIQ